MTQTIPPGWYADPSGQHGSRWWDGSQWTEHTQPPPGQGGGYGQGGQIGQYGQDQAAAVPGQAWGAPLGVQPGAVYTKHSAEQVQRQVQEQAGVQPAGPGGGTLFSEPVLVVNQKSKIIEVTNEYAVFDQGGKQIGSVVEVGQSALKKAARVLTSWDQFFSHRLEVRDAAGTVQLLLHRPAKVFKSKVIVSLPDGSELGVIAQQNVFGKIRFDLQAGGTTIGAIKAENWRAWNFSIVDQNDVEVARVTKTWEGLARAMFTTADNYVVQLHRPLPQPLHSMVVAAALTIDTALKQDSRGLG
ncbi:phospholipid scramblase-related protein [Frankia sp. AvcI1]|uniref:phospholipid scramblase-related protein n=2 Tax=Frankia sp. AvcI1 TaxID=573496 RepID=UPI002118385A|nr:phospholipid scramblase-related protein [Frankia sp. AvcI1]